MWRQRKGRQLRRPGSAVIRSLPTPDWEPMLVPADNRIKQADPHKATRSAQAGAASNTNSRPQGRRALNACRCPRSDLQFLVGNFVGENLLVVLVAFDDCVAHCINPLERCPKTPLKLHRKRGTTNIRSCAISRVKSHFATEPALCTMGKRTPGQ